MDIAVAMGLVAELGAALGVSKINELSGVWAHAVDAHWTIALNGHKEPKEHQAMSIPPFYCAVWFNGWPAGLFNAFGGTIAAGSAANERTFCAALKRAIKRSTKPKGG
jgi:hypothetical protein